jgi:hypothetical protein
MFTTPSGPVTGWYTEESDFESREGKKFLHVVQTGPEAHPASYPIDTGGSFSVGTATEA